MTRRDDPDDVDHAPDSKLESLLRRVAHVEEELVLLPQVGAVISGKYRLEARLGRGGMGAVFRAVHLVSNKAVALKWMLHPMSDEHVRRRFVREAQAAGRIDHPNVVNVYDVGEVGTAGYLVMELLHGETLRARLARGPLAAQEALRLILPAMRGVAAAHRAGVVHCDLKPDNIFLCTDSDGSEREPKVLDFGISAVLSVSPSDPTITKDGLIGGTPAYMAPDRFANAHAVDMRSDVYSLGVILYEALTGRLPVEADSYPGLILAIAHEQPKPPSVFCPGLSSQLEAIVLRALAKRPEERYASVQSLMAALAPFAESDSPSVPALRPRRGRAAPIAIGVAGIVALGASLYVAPRLSGSVPGRSVSPPTLPAGAAALRGPTSAAPAAEVPPLSAALASGGTPFEPQPPLLAGRECTPCLAEHCSREVDACASDAGCATFIDKFRQAEPPLVANREYLADFAQGRWELDHKQSNWMRSRDALQSCARRHCLEPCAIGRKFDCVGRFEWPASYPATVQLRFRMLPMDEPTASYASWRIRACGPGGVCTPSLGNTLTDAAGFGELSIDLGKTRPNTQPRAEFDGVIEIDGGPAFFPQTVQQSGPFLHQWYKRYLVSSRRELRRTYEPRNLPIPDKTRGILQVQPQDCEYAGARGLRLEIWRERASGYVLCTDCRIAYPDETGIPNTAQREFGPWSLNAAEVALPPEDVILILRDTHTEQPVSTMSRVRIRPGYENSVVMFPGSRSQMRALPREARDPAPARSALPGASQ